MRSRSGVLLFFVGVTMMLAIAALGRFGLQPSMQDYGLRGYQAIYGDAGMLPFLVFALGFPVGAGLCAIGAVWMSAASRGTLRWFVTLTLVAAVTSVLVPAMFGAVVSPSYFGAGGVLILLLVAATFWYWGRYRAGLPETARGAADLQACGYLWFAVAAWNLCGVGGMPGYALYPERVIRFGSQGFAAGQMKVVMLCLVLGWTFSLLGFRRAALPVAARTEPARSATRRRPKRRGKAGRS
jgi:hypothetical protein